MMLWGALLFLWMVACLFGSCTPYMRRPPWTFHCQHCDLPVEHFHEEHQFHKGRAGKVVMR